MYEALTYDDVLLVPQFSDIRSREEVKLTTSLSDSISFDLPIIASPMDSVTGEETASVMHQNGGISVIHRYNTIEEQSKIISSLRDKHSNNIKVGGAVGVTGDYIERAIALYLAGASFICIDVAHGHSILMKEALINLRTKFPKGFHIMAGNVATLEGFNDLADWGADSIRCNIGGGSICTTRIQTGHGVPGLETIFQCARSDRSAKIIADGGIKNAGDIVKALAAGADAVMLGSLLAGTTESPAKMFKSSDGTLRKEYRGMASAEAQIAWRGKVGSLEGVAHSVPFRGPLKDILDDLEKGIRSGLSYSGARSILELQATAQWVRQSAASQIESTAHIRNK